MHTREERIPTRRRERLLRPSKTRSHTAHPSETYAFQCVGERLIQQPALTRSPPPPAHFLTARLPGRSPSSADDQGHIRDGLLEGCGPQCSSNYNAQKCFALCPLVITPHARRYTRGAYYGGHNAALLHRAYHSIRQPYYTSIYCTSYYYSTLLLPLLSNLTCTGAYILYTVTSIASPEWF